jgi:hypothetical protein
MKRRIELALTVLALGGVACGVYLYASDHDDGENDRKSRALNLTDLYVFREGDQTGVPADNQNLILIMNVNPRSLPRQQYFYSTNALYDFHLTRRASKTDPVPGTDDVVLRFQFGSPDAHQRQAITVTALKDGQVLSTSTRSDNGMPIETTSLKDMGTPTVAFPSSTGVTPTINPILLGGTPLTVFAGLAEDPFYFDVEAFFKVRAGALGIGPAVGFNPPASAADFTAGYNVLSLVVRVPITFLQGATADTTFDVWETISIPE